MRKYIVLIVAVVIVIKVIETNPNLFTQYVVPSQIQVNQSQAAYQYAQAAKINDEIRRQREQDNGLGVNMVARVVSGNGLTDFERLASAGFVLLSVCGLAPGAIIIALIALARLGKSSKVEV